MSLTCKGFDTIFVIGTLLSRESQVLLDKMQGCLQEGAQLIYLFTMEDAFFTPKSTFFSRYEVGSEEGVLALLAKALLAKVPLPQEFRAYLETLDEGYLSAESNLGEEEIEEIVSLVEKSKGVLFWIGDDVLLHPRSENALRFAHAIVQHLPVSVFGAQVLGDVTQIEPVSPLHSYDGTVVYVCEQHAGETPCLIGSPQFKIAAKIDDKTAITLTLNDAVHGCTFVQDNALKGTVALFPLPKRPKGYPYHVTKLVKADQ